MEEPVMVSIICNAFNHEGYIRDALEGFLTQRTDFRFEVLVHDDASTDKTPDIIREYEKNYPDIIKPIYETENQYSKHDGTLEMIQYNRAKGKYIAFCEGDDFWTDPLKLQKQVDALEAHPEVCICTHAASVMDARTKRNIKIISPRSEDSIIPVEDVIKWEAAFVATGSTVYRADIPNRYQFPLLHLMDYSFQILGALPGGMLYLKDNMSVYRIFSKGSWSEGFKKTDISVYIAFREAKIAMLKKLDEETEFKHHEAVADRLASNCFQLALLKKEWKKVFAEENERFYREMPFLKRLKTRIKYRFPKFAAFVHRIKSL